MAKIKLTKNELKMQKDVLKRFQRYLPTLILKKQQLQMEIRTTLQLKKEKDAAIADIRDDIAKWIEVFGEEVNLSEMIVVDEIQKERGNIAGIDIPVFNGITFKDISYNLFEKPLWVDRAIIEIKRVIALKAEISVLDEQVRLLSDELRTTSQRVNLFEKVKIPEAKENIRKIRIYLGDQQTAAVVRGKISKNKLLKAS